MSTLLRKVIEPNITFIAWLMAAAASIGSLVLSEIQNLEPCKLCWYQRIAMFPLAFILGTAVKQKDNNAPYYVLPISITGGIIAFYHSLLQWGVIEETAATCSVDSSCAFAQINWFGFLTIPFGAFVSFVLISLLMFWQIRLNAQAGHIRGEKS